MSHTSHNITSNVFTGAQDTDTDPRLVKNTDFISALNIRNGKGVDTGAVANAQGNTLVPYILLPVGTNKCIGTLEDALENTIFYFIWNSNGSHGIYRMYPTELRTDRIARGIELNFDQNHYIHSARLVDRTFLYWTDAFETETGLVGNEPRKLNVAKASIYNKSFQYEWHFAANDQFNYPSLGGTSFTVNSTTISLTNLQATNRQTTIAAIKAQLIVAGYYVSSVNSTLIFGSTGVLVPVTTTAATTWTRLVPYNYYGTGTGITSANHISWAKVMPSYAPTVSYIADTTGVNNRLYTQYCIRYIFDDNEKSAWGSLSITPYNKILTGYKTLIDFYDEKLNDVEWLTIIKKVEIGVKYGNTQFIRSVAILDTSEIGFAPSNKNIFTALVASNHYTHTDSVFGEIVGSDESTSDNNTQVIKPYDNVPELTHTIDMVSDENGSTLALVANNVRGKDNISTDTSVEITEVPVTDNMGAYLVPLPSYVTLKPYAEYDWGIVYYDKYGRSSAVQECGSFFTTDKMLQPDIRFTINHIPPSWATQYQIVRTRDKREISYKIYLNPNIVQDVPNVTRWEISTFTFNDPPVTGSDLTVFFDTKERSEFELVSNGDRLRAWTGASGVSSIDEKIIGYRINATGQVYILTKRIALTQALGNVELYTPKSVEEEFYYETGMKMPILGGFHFGNDQTQTALIPSIVKLIGGDTKWEDELATVFRQRYYTDQREQSVNEDIGRANIIDPNAKKQWFKNEIRFSERYNLHSFYNGLSAFRGLDYIEVDYQFGSIQKLENTTRAVLAICQYKIQPIYVNRDRLLDFNSNQSIGRTSRILNIAEPVINNWGTRNPESVINIDGHIYAFDSYNGIIWRFAQDGQTPISERGRHNFFKRIGKSRMNITRLTDKIVSGYEKNYDTIYFSFSQTASDAAFTVGYEDMDESAGFKGLYSFVPEQFSRVNDLFYCALNGDLWQHDTGTPCNFFGVQYDAKIEFVHNAEPASIKTPYVIREQATDIWFVEKAETLPTLSYPNKQLSKIPSVRFGVYEGQIQAEFLRNQIDDSQEFASITPTNLKEATALLMGELLKYDAIKILLTKRNPHILGTLLKVDISFTKSENTI